MNVAILRGRLSSPPRHQELRSGDLLTSLEVTTRGEEGQAASVPVAWFSTSKPPQWNAGDEVVVVGTVRRRFFRTGGGATASRTEVVADQVLLASRTAVVARCLDGIIGALDELAHPPAPEPKGRGRGQPGRGSQGNRSSDAGAPAPATGRRQPAQPTAAKAAKPPTPRSRAGRSRSTNGHA